jgi:hypothetical protein
VRADPAHHANGAAPASREGRKAVALKRWEELNPDVLHYQVIFADTTLETDALKSTRAFLQGQVAS